MKYYSIYWLLFLFYFPAFSQYEITDGEHDKYWYYKKRLHEKFVNVGLQNESDFCVTTGGQSIPASWYQGNEVDGYEINYEEDNLMWFGQYLGVLATEYKLLMNNDQTSQADKTKEHLYYAMMAYERLDKKSETLAYPFGSNTPNPNCNSGLNGFFIRGDIADPRYYNLNYNYTATPNNNHSCVENISKTSLSDYFDNSVNETFYDQYDIINGGPTFDYYNELKCKEKRKESDAKRLENQLNLSKEDAERWAAMNFYPSQDQIASLFMGFALVKKCMDGVVYDDGSGTINYDFEAQAVNYTDLITTYLRNNDWFGRLEDGTDHKWGRGFRYESGWGLAKAARAITGVDYITTGDDDVKLLKSKLYWEYLAHPYSGTIFLSSINTWPIDGILVFGNPLTYMSYKANVKGGYHANFMQLYAAIAGSWWNADNILASYGAVTDQGINSLLHAYLHDKTVGTALGKNYFKSLIESAPCQGPSYKPGDNPSYTGASDWISRNRWWHPQGVQEGHMNGLDFMILFNLYS